VYVDKLKAYQGDPPNDWSSTDPMLMEPIGFQESEEFPEETSS